MRSRSNQFHRLSLLLGVLMLTLQTASKVQTASPHPTTLARKLPSLKSKARPDHKTEKVSKLENRKSSLKGLEKKLDYTKVTAKNSKLSSDIDKTAIPRILPLKGQMSKEGVYEKIMHAKEIDLDETQESLEIADDGKYYEWNGIDEKEDLKSEYNELEIPEEEETEGDKTEAQEEEEEEAEEEEEEEEPRDPDEDSRSEFSDVDMEMPTEELANEGENLVEDLRIKEEEDNNDAGDQEDEEENDNQDSDLTSIAEGFNELMPNVVPSLEFNGDIINQIISDLVYNIVEKRVEENPKTKEQREEEEHEKDLSDQEREEEVELVKVNVEEPYQEDYEGEVSDDLLRILRLVKDSADLKMSRANVNVTKNAHLLYLPILMKCAMSSSCHMERKLSSLYTRLYKENLEFNKLIDQQIGNGRKLLENPKTHLFSFKEYQDSHKFRVLEGDEAAQDAPPSTDTETPAASGEKEENGIKKLALFIIQYFVQNKENQARRLRDLSEEESKAEAPASKDDLDTPSEEGSESKWNVIQNLRNWWASFNKSNSEESRILEEAEEIEDDPIEIIVQKFESDYKGLLGKLNSGFTNEELRDVTNDYIKMMKINLLKNQRVGDEIIEESTAKLDALRDHLNSNEITVGNMENYLEEVRTIWREGAEDSINPGTSAKLNAMADSALDFENRMRMKIPPENALNKKFKSFMDKYRFKLREYGKFLETEENQKKMKEQLEESIDELIDQTKNKHVNKTNVASLLNDLKNDVNSRLFKSLNEKNLKYILHNTVSSAIMDLERLENPEKSSNFLFTKNELGDFTRRVIKIMQELNKDKKRLGIQLHTGILKKILASGEDILDKMGTEQKKIDLVRLSKAVLDNVRAANKALEDDEVKQDLSNLITDYINYPKVREEFDMTGVKATKTYDFLTKDILNVKSNMPTRLLRSLNRNTLKNAHKIDKESKVVIKFLRRLLTQWASKKYSSWEQKDRFQQAFRVLSGNSLENFKI